MNNLTPTKTTKGRVAPKAYRISAKVKHACTLIAQKSLTQRDAAKLAGMNETALGRALQKPHVQAFLDEQKTLFTQQVESLKETAALTAYTLGIDLMHNAKSESVKARMVELFKGERDKTPQNQVNVAIAVGGNGYEFAPHGAQVVEINPDHGATDTASVGDDAQEPETKE